MPDRFAEVQKGLFRGGKPLPKDLEILKDIWGINKIVSLDEESGQDIHPICQRLGLKHIIWGLGDGNDPKVAALKKRIIPTLLLEGPTYIHCFHGKDRTGMAVAMFRVYIGMPLKTALTEAYKFGMGLGLSPDVKRSYYDSVVQFSKELKNDKNNSIDAVSLTRQNNLFGPAGDGWNDMSHPQKPSMGLPPHADIEFSQLSRTASSSKLYCKCNSSVLLKPNKYWWGAAELAKKNQEGERLYSAFLAQGTKVERINKHLTQQVLHNLMLKDIDVIALRGDQYLVLNPTSLVNIQEEDDDINDMFMPDVGMRDNSTNYTFVYPGSGAGVGGMPDGAAGVVQLPYSGIGNI